MSCKSVSHLLPLFDDPELGTEDRATVAAHVATCADCAQELATIREAQWQLASWRDVQVPATGPERVLANVKDAHASPARKGWRWRLSLQLASALAACAVVAILWGGWPTSHLVPSEFDGAAQPSPMLFMATQEEAAQSFAARSVALDATLVEPMHITVQSADPAAFVASLVDRLEELSPQLSLDVRPTGDGSFLVELPAVTQDLFSAVLAAIRSSGPVTVDANALDQLDTVWEITLFVEEQNKSH